MLVSRQKNNVKDPYELIIEAIDDGDYKPGDRLVEAELAERFGVSRTPIREALQRLETQSFLNRDGRSLMVASLNHNQVGELYTVRAELEGLATFLAAQHAAPEEIRVLYNMIESDREYISDPQQLSRANRRFHNQLHLASHNNFLILQLQQVHRAMALLANTSLAADGRGESALQEHLDIVSAIEAKDGEGARQALKQHLSFAFETRLKQDVDELALR
jgi:DNA-binding GntR family transcriptional regulator|tara:strand:- start:4664 stop:5320 length:657 start_codon:yes stop_codon:yes gene_type:complete